MTKLSNDQQAAQARVDRASRNLRGVAIQGSAAETCAATRELREAQEALALLVVRNDLERQVDAACDEAAARTGVEKATLVQACRQIILGLAVDHPDRRFGVGFNGKVVQVFHSR